jgi:hypothetical protein
MPRAKKQAASSKRRKNRDAAVVIEEKTRTFPARVKVVRREPVMLARALGEADVIAPIARVAETTVIKRRVRKT